MHIPFVDLQAQYKSNKAEINSAINNVIKNTEFILGKEVEEFEKNFSQFLGVKNCVTLASGTDALIIGMRSLSLPPGSEILIPSNTFIATALAASFNGHKPVFVDADPNDHGINLSDLAKKINSRTRAIVVVHLYGQSDKIGEIDEVIKKSGRTIYLIEDACQAHGAEYKGKKVGTFGIFSTFSFYPSKNLGAYGDGGAICTNNDKLANKLKLLRQYGQRKKYYHDVLGVNSRLDTIQAAVLNVKLPYLEKWNKKRQEIASLYTELIKRSIPQIKTPHIFTERKSIFHLYLIRTKKRNRLQKYLKNDGVTTLIHYPIPLHLQKAYKFLKYKRGDLPVSEKLAQEILSLPIYPELKKNQTHYVVNLLKRFYEKSNPNN